MILGSIMRKSVAVLCFALIVAIVFLSGCTSSQPTTTSAVTAAPITYQPPSDRELIQLGIADAEQRCVDLLPRGVSTDKCVMTSSDKDKMVNLFIQRIKEEEQDCLTVLPRSDPISYCTVTDNNKRLMGWHTATTFIIQSPSTNPSSDADTDMKQAVEWSIQHYDKNLGTKYYT